MRLVKRLILTQLHAFRAVCLSFFNRYGGSNLKQKHCSRRDAEDAEIHVFSLRSLRSLQEK